MIRKFCFGNVIETFATVEKIKESDKSEIGLNYDCLPDGRVRFRIDLADDDAVYGLGEQVRGINKRGWIYKTENIDDPLHTESRTSMYSSHNFVLVSKKAGNFGLFFDVADCVEYDVGYSDNDRMTITANADFDLYVIEEKNLTETVRAFRKLIGKSYVPPKWALGYGQSRFGYKTIDDVRSVVENFKKNDLPIDMVYLDIDYMDGLKDFTVDEKAFPDFPAFVEEMKKEGVRLIPIIDAAVKIENGYSVYEEGLKRGYFCKDKDGKPYEIGVWAGDSVLPDFLNAEVRCWFGEKYKGLLDAGIEGFWNDMNEPAVIYGKAALQRSIRETAKYEGKNVTADDFYAIQDSFCKLGNSKEDFDSFYHDADGKKIVHSKVHNLYGFNMVRSAAEYFDKYNPSGKYLLFSRSSSIGMHRYGGMWTGDNFSWWSHMLLGFKMLPSLNMCGFLYVGADLGGFSSNVTEDLLLRWFAMSTFVPLMRNHSTGATRRQEPYAFGKVEIFRNFLNIRYALIPYLYSEFERCSNDNEMMFKPLAFDYEKDERARTIEDQLMFGKNIMLAPVFEQNSKGRYVYLPEDFDFVSMRSCEDYVVTRMRKGDHYIDVPLSTIAFFSKPDFTTDLLKYFDCRSNNIDKKGVELL